MTDPRRTAGKAPEGRPVGPSRQGGPSRPPPAAGGGGVFWRRRLVPIGVVALAAFGAGSVLGARHQASELVLTERYVHAWERGDYARMYTALSDKARKRVSEAAFAAAHKAASGLATVQAITAGRPARDGDHLVRVPMLVRTHIFGSVRLSLALPLSGSGDALGVDWRRSLTFPGVPRGASLRREVTLPDRATLLTRDGKVLAKGAGRAADAEVADVAGDTVGQLGPIGPERLARLRALGVPAGANVGISGLERALDEQLLGRPGGRLLAGQRLLASSEPRQADALRTTIAPGVERAAVTALAGRLGGVVAIDPRNGELLAFAGIAFSGLQPPGSTFKIVTLTGALENGAARVSDTFPVQTAATLEGVALQNANGESCGGTLTDSFAKSCNSVFAPLGARLGPEKLVAAAERFGFNAPPGIAGAATSTLPAARDIGDDLAVGSTAIGQGRVQATALQMASIAATIGLRGRRPALTLSLGGAGGTTAPTARVLPRATDATTARAVEKMMLAVVRFGTGTAASLPGVRVAGKTGTAELETRKKCEPDPADPTLCPPPTDPSNTDAWFAAYAPAGDGRPRVAVGVLLVRAGAGGDSAAPVAREVLSAALKRG